MTNAELARFDTEAQDMPLWIRSVNAALPLASQFIVHGNIRDLHPVPTSIDKPPEFHSTAQAIWDVLSANGFDGLAVYSPLDGLKIPELCRREDWQPDRAVEEALKVTTSNVGGASTIEGLNSAIAYVATSQDPKLGLVIDYMSQAAQPDVDTSTGYGLAMLTALRHVHNPRRFLHEQRDEAVHHPIFWMVDQPNDLPHWMLTGDGVRQVPIGLPELATRAAVTKVLAPPGLPEDYPARLADATEGLTVRGMVSVAGFLRGTDGDDYDIEAAVRAYRVGVSENPWRNRQLREKLQDGLALIEQRVVGQRRAAQRVLDLLTRSAMGLTAAHQARAGSGVRGVLYFAGPTGVGKTEMAKAIAELVFGKEEALVRFDMSEFAHEASEARLIGSPPGYIGHNAGGELTNAVRSKPFSVVLFDEIDKAHGRILDKFLQILSDGRLTDGSGDTVYFTDTIIVFTSNQGVLDAGHIDTSTDEGVNEYQNLIRQSVEDFFTNRLNRPELLGRIGDNIVAFRPIADDIAATIASRNIDNIIRRVQASTGSTLTIADSVRAELIARATKDLSKGGRGIGLALESGFVNPLARALFSLPADSTLQVTELTEDADGNPEVSFS